MWAANSRQDLEEVGLSKNGPYSMQLVLLSFDWRRGESILGDERCKQLVLRVLIHPERAQHGGQRENNKLRGGVCDNRYRALPLRRDVARLTASGNGEIAVPHVAETVALFHPPHARAENLHLLLVALNARGGFALGPASTETSRQHTTHLHEFRPFLQIGALQQAA